MDFDVKTAIRQKLNEVGLTVTFTDAVRYDALLDANYGERRWGDYVPSVGTSSRTVDGTSIDCVFTLTSPQRVQLLRLDVSGTTSERVPERELYSSAVKGLQASVGFRDLLRSRKSDDRSIAAKALGELKDPSAVDGLLSVLTDREHFYVFRDAARALVMIGDARVAPALRRLAEEIPDRSKTDVVRRAASDLDAK